MKNVSASELPFSYLRRLFNSMASEESDKLESDASVLEF